MKRSVSTVAIIAGLTMPLVADEPRSRSSAQVSVGQSQGELKTTPDALPSGIKKFNGMLVGRLAAKDVER
ncbi:MAG: hypothetical protein KDB00_26180, partial [Planctomycetales bacterium]|nr:hypothetical protein [Planctomycetales bacterium]